MAGFLQDDEKRCIVCDEIIKKTAKKCRWCKEWLEGDNCSNAFKILTAEMTQGKHNSQEGMSDIPCDNV
jgi:hypothetical protein